MERLGFAACVLALATIGCVSNRLEGPIYSSDGPPYIASRAATTPAPIEIEHRLVLIGDAGLWLEDDPTLRALGRWSEEVPSTVVFLGDNLYDHGLQDDDRERGERILAQQLEATAADKIFVPGNHDWGISTEGQDPASIPNQQAFVDGWPAGDAAFLPKDGCLGPAKRVIPTRAGGPALVLVLLDPTPWVIPSATSRCPRQETHQAFLAELEASLSDHRDDWIVIGSHYPLLTGGPHGGLSYGAFADLIVGFIAWRYGGLSNTYEPGYADWIGEMEGVLSRLPVTLVAGGHDHSLQVLDGRGLAAAEVVSGAGAPERVSTVTQLPETRFAHAHAGFMVVDFGMRGTTNAAVLRVIENGKTDPVFEMDLSPPAERASRN